LVVKANGRIDKLVEKVGPKRFGIVSVDCHKVSSKWMLCDFYGNVIVDPVQVHHNRRGFEKAIERLRQTLKEAGLASVIVAVERAGNYHELAKRVFQRAGFTTRVVHPFATKHFRCPADHGVKTDDTDLAAIHRATVIGFALEQPLATPQEVQLQLTARMRSDLVKKRSALKCQIREHLLCVMPGYDPLFGEQFWKSGLAMALALCYRSATAIAEASLDEMACYLKSQKVRHIKRSLQKVKAWAETAAAAEPHGEFRWPMVNGLWEDLSRKTREIVEAEVALAKLLASSPYLLLLAIPGINVTSAAELAGEMGGIRCYANPNAITGRAGLYPCSYQTSSTDVKGLPLVRHGNKRMRNALLKIASNLLVFNQFYQRRKLSWQQEQTVAKIQRVRVAKQFSRLLFSMVAGGQIVPHPCCRQPDYVLNKLLTYLIAHDSELETIKSTMFAACSQLPGRRRKHEAERLQHESQRYQRKRGSVRKVNEILNLVIARLLGVAIAEDNQEKKASD
jgi:transposase